MPITEPAVDGPLGLGLTAQVTAPVGEWQSGWNHELSIVETLTGRIIGFGSAQAAHAPSASIVVGESRTESGGAFYQAYPQFPSTPHGAKATARYVVRDPVASEVISTEDRVITYDTLTGLQVLLPKLIQATSGGYAQADRDRDIKTSAAVLSAFPLTTAIGELVEVALDAQFGCPPMPLLVPSSTILLSGDGTLDRPSGSTGVYAYGFTFRFEVVPPGLSVIDGVMLEYPERMAQFGIIRVDSAGNEYVSDRYEFHHDQERVCWGIPFPKRLAYSVLPGVSMRFSWLLFLTAG